MPFAVPELLVVRWKVHIYCLRLMHIKSMNKVNKKAGLLEWLVAKPLLFSALYSLLIGAVEYVRMGEGGNRIWSGSKGTIG